MGKPYSADQRERVVRAVEVGGQSRHAAARQFGVGASGVIRWMQPGAGPLLAFAPLESSSMIRERRTRKGAMKLIDLAQVVRSKNAGPSTLSFDLLFATEADYLKAVRSPALGVVPLARLFGVEPQRVRVHPYPPAYAIKIAIDRAMIAGTPGDRDVYGAQQHGPLLEIEL